MSTEATPRKSAAAMLCNVVSHSF
jgi:hypothetical protein